MKTERMVLVLAAVIFLWFLGAHDLWAPDEPFFGEGAREMLVDGQWLVTHVNGVVNSHKPPLFFWLIAVFSIPFGAVTEFSARLPSVLAALGTVALVIRLGRRWYGPKTAALAGLLLATSYMFWDKARWSQIDSLLCFLIWVALSAFESWRSGDADGRRAGALFWLAAGLAVLAKGPVGLLLPVGIVLLVLAFEHDLGSLRRFAPLVGPAVFVFVAGAWALAATLWGPAEYSVIGALREHFVERGMHGMHHVQPFWYYAERLPLSLLPWTGLLPGALVLAWRDRRRAAGQRMSLLTAIFVVVFFSISTEKRDLYVLPAFPAIALMMAVMVGRISGWREGLACISHQVSSRGRRGDVPGCVFDSTGAQATSTGRRAPGDEKPLPGAVHRRPQQEAGEICRLVVVQKRRFFGNLGVNLRVFWFGVQEYASAQTLDFLNLARKSLVSESRTTPSPPEFPDGNRLEDAATLDRRWVTVGQTIVGGLFTVVAVAVPFVSGRVEYLPGWMVYLLGVVFLATGVAALVTALRGRAFDSVVATATGMVVLYLVATALVYPTMEPRKSSRAFALKIKEITAASRAEGNRVMAWRAGNIPTAVAFYSDGVYPVETEDPEVLAEHLGQDALVYAIVRADQMDEIPADVRDRLTVLFEQRLSRMDLALVANRRR